MKESDFLIRNKQVDETTSFQKLNEMISFFLSKDSGNTISPNSAVYRLAVSKYNEKVSKMERPPVPSWFCGYIDKESGFLIDLPTDSQIRFDSGFVQTPLQENTLTDYTSGQYGEDRCLDLGLPGSFGYSNCEGLSGDEDIEVSGIDWEAQVALNYGESGAVGAGGAAGGQCPSGGTGGPVKISNAKITGNGTTQATLSMTTEGRDSWPVKTLGPGTCVNAELRINGKKADWMRIGQDSKDLKNVFNGYNGWVPPKSGSTVSIELISVTGQDRASASAKWP